MSKDARLLARMATNHDELMRRYHHWLYLEPPDNEFIEAGLVWLLDRELEGDPAWGMLVAPPGGIKSEVIRSFSDYHRAYTLDTLTKSTLISGQAEKDQETGEYIPIAGIMQDLDGKVLVLKDFTTVLSTNEDTRTEIYGQLRAAYDGYFEKAFGTMRRKVSVHAIFGVVAGVTPIIDKYTRMHSLLGERFLYIRSNPNRKYAALQAHKNTGKENEMRAQLSSSVESYIRTLDEAGRFSNPPVIDNEFDGWLINIGDYIAMMRCNVFTHYEGGDLKSMEVVGIEIPTRITKQLNKTLRLLAIIREHEDPQPTDMKTIQRIARDTVVQRRQKILDVFAAPEINFEQHLSTSDIAGRAHQLYYKTVNNECRIMNVLGILETNKHGHYKPSETFMDSLLSAYHLPEGIPLPPVSSEKKPKNGLFSERIHPKAIPPDSPGAKLAAFATRLLEKNGRSMGRVLFFNVMYEAHYHTEEVESVLRDYRARVGPHWFRHQRLSHLAEALNPFQLHEQIGFWETIEPAVSYVHGRVEDYLQATKLVREGRIEG